MKGEQGMQGMSIIVKAVARWLKAFILLFGIYDVLYGHLSPGGGFSGGVIAACAFILLTLAEGQKASLWTLSKVWSLEADSAGALLFLGVAVMGIFKTGLFLKNFIITPDSSSFQLFSGGVISIYNIAIGLVVCMSIYMIFEILSAIHVIETKGKRKIKQRGLEK